MAEGSSNSSFGGILQKTAGYALSALLAVVAIIVIFFAAAEAAKMWQERYGDDYEVSENDVAPPSATATASVDVQESAPVPTAAERARSRAAVCQNDERARGCSSNSRSEEGVFAQSGGVRVSGGSYRAEGGRERSRISDPITSSTARCDPNEEFCWRFPAGYPRQRAHSIIDFIQAEIRNPQGREPPAELNRWQFTDTVPGRGASPLSGGGEVVWIENASFNGNR